MNDLANQTREPYRLSHIQHPNKHTTIDINIYSHIIFIKNGILCNAYERERLGFLLIFIYCNLSCAIGTCTKYDHIYIFHTLDLNSLSVI